MKISAVLFDLDGVLINSPSAIWESHNIAAKKTRLSYMQERRDLQANRHEMG